MGFKNVSVDIADLGSRVLSERVAELKNPRVLTAYLRRQAAIWAQNSGKFDARHGRSLLRGDGLCHLCGVFRGWHNKITYPARLISCFRNRQLARLRRIALETSVTATNKRA